MDYKNIKKIIAVVLVIVVIIGIIVGFRYAFTPPCVNNDYIRYKDYNNVCGPECTGDKKAMPVYDDNKEISSIVCCDTYICTDKNSKYYNTCVPAGLCSNKEYGLIDNKDNCNCKNDCKNDDYPTSFPTKGTDMRKLNDGSYAPKVDTYCGFPCEYDKTNGGFCSLDTDAYYNGDPTTKKLLCGYEQDNNKRKGSSGCFNPDEYQKCGNNGVICPKSGESMCDTDTGYCKSVSCPKNEGYVCATDKDCISSNDKDEENKKYYCDLGNKTLINKGITQIGVCMYDNGKDEPTMKTNTDLFDIDRCSNVNYISYKNKYNGLGFLKCNPKDKDMCPDSDSKLCVGYNLDINCDNNVKYACAKFGLCHNGWQEKIDKKSETGCTDDKTPTHPVNKGNQICCDVENIVDVVDKNNNIKTCKTSKDCDDLGSCMDGKCKYCCSQPGTKINGKTLCANITEYGYSKGLLGQSKNMDEKITCTSDTDCSTDNYNNALYENLGISKDKPPTYDNMNYSTLYCDKKDGVCKAMCGYVNQNNNNTSPFLISDVSKHIKNKNSADKTSFCYQNTQGCTLTTNQVFNYGKVNDIPICKSIEPTGDNRFWWSKDINKGLKREYNTSFHMDFINTDKNQSCSNKGSGLCLGLAKGLDDVQKVHINDTGKGGTCTFDIDCLNNNFYITDTSDKPDNALKWSDLSNPLKSNDGLVHNKKTKNTSPNPTWKKTEQLISQTSPSHKKDKDKTCTGNSHGFDNSLTYNIYEYKNLGDNTNICVHKTFENNNPQLLYTGEYCPYGVDTYNNICIK